MVRLVGSLALVGVLVSICVGRMKLVNYCLELVRRGTRYCRMERSRIKDKPLRHSVGQLAEGLSGLTFTAQSVS